MIETVKNQANHFKMGFQVKFSAGNREPFFQNVKLFKEFFHITWGLHV